jgi:hypothetical protein
MISFVIFLSEIIKSVTMKWAKHIVHLGEIRYVYSMLVGKCDRKRQHWRLKCRREGK